MVRGQNEGQRDFPFDQGHGRQLTDKDAQGVLKEQYVTIGFKPEGGGEDRLKLRRIR